MKYLNLDKHYPLIFNIVRKNLAFPNDPVPNYAAEDKGLDQLSGILERIKTDFYYKFYEKASYLFMGITLGHYFSNGNKRLAIISLTYFAQLNNYEIKSIKREYHKKIIKKLLPNITFGRKIKGSTVFDNMLYDITVHIASGRKDFHSLKEKVTAYLEFALVCPSHKQD